MDPSSVFLVCSYGVVPAWLLLALAPGGRLTQQLVHGIWLPVLLGAAYGVAFATAPPTPPGASFATLAGVTAFFASPHIVLVGWIHYIVFDLFVGAWEVRDARRLGVAHAWVLPCLALTFLAGPLGLLLYLTVRFASTRATSLIEAANDGRIGG